MFATKTQQIDIKRWRSLSFTFLTGLLALAMLGIGSFEFYPAWILREPGQSIHLWHIAELFAMGSILLGGTLLALLRRPLEKPLLAQFYVLSALTLGVGFTPFDLTKFAFFILAALFAAAYPRPRALLSFSREGPVSIPLLVLSLMMALFLVPVAWREIGWQIIGMTTDLHAIALHWIGSAVLMVLLIFSGVLSSTRRPGWKELCIITGIAYCFLGVIAMTLQDGYAGSWSGGGGLFAIIAGIWYIILSMLEGRRTKEMALAPASATTSETEPVPQTASITVSEAVMTH